MRILYVGELEEHARSWQRLVAMRELGHEVDGISTVSPGSRPIGKGHIVPRVLSKLGWPLDSAGVNERMSNLPRDTSVDVIWVEKGLMVRRASLVAAQTAYPNAVLAFYSEDDMFARHNQSRYFRDCLPAYDVVFTTKSCNSRANELPGLGARRVVFVDKAYDPHRHRPMALSAAQSEKFGAEVGFVGSYEDVRAARLLMLAAAGLNVRVWGNGWERMIGSHPLLRVEGRPIFNDDYVASLCATKINLCFLRKANRDRQTDRTMEIPACGAFMLAERTDEHRRLFEEDREAVYFDIDNEDELLSKVRHYLHHHVDRKAIAAAGRRRCEVSDYSHHSRLRQMLSECTNVV